MRVAYDKDKGKVGIGVSRVGTGEGVLPSDCKVRVGIGVSVLPSDCKGRVGIGDVYYPLTRERRRCSRGWRHRR